MAEAQKGLNDEGGCAVDWSWLAGERIASITSGLDFLTITFASIDFLMSLALRRTPLHSKRSFEVAILNGSACATPSVLR